MPTLFSSAKEGRKDFFPKPSQPEGPQAGYSGSSGGSWRDRGDIRSGSGAETDDTQTSEGMVSRSMGNRRPGVQCRPGPPSTRTDVAVPLGEDTHGRREACDEPRPWRQGAFPVSGGTWRCPPVPKPPSGGPSGRLRPPCQAQRATGAWFTPCGPPQWD